MRFKVEVKADSTGTWSSNQKRFDTADEAAHWVRNLAMRWTAVYAWRVVDLGMGILNDPPVVVMEQGV